MRLAAQVISSHAVPAIHAPHCNDEMPCKFRCCLKGKSLPTVSDFAYTTAGHVCTLGSLFSLRLS